MNIDQSFVYDIESYPNVFTINVQGLSSDFNETWEVSDFINNSAELMQFFNHLALSQIPMIGFNTLHYDYPVIHYIFNNPNVTAQQIYDFSMSIINSNNKYGHTIWPSDRFTPQIDVFQMFHFHNPAKSTSLKALQINMRSKTVVDMPVEWGTVLSNEQTETLLIPYNDHDTRKTKEFTLMNMDALNFRISLIQDFGIDVLNWPDTKIGSKMMEQRIGDDLCYDWSSGRKQKRQTPREQISLKDIIFPYVRFTNPEFNRVKQYLESKILKASEIDLNDGKPASIVTKGVFKGLKAHVGGIDFHFGTGGIHGSVERTRIESTDDFLIRDIDVASLYPSIAIVNNLSPEHLGEYFSQIYAQLPKERKEWQTKKGKKCVEANALKLASNGVYGNSNNKYSPFYDPKFTMTITINGQLMLCMLAERLVNVPTLRMIQINTDGITYYIHKDFEPQAAKLCQEWEKETALVLEAENYNRMWIRDVNNYIAENKKGELKLKGAYWSPDCLNYLGSIANAQPPAWHKDLSNVVSIRAAVSHMVHGTDIEQFIRYTENPFDFICRAKVNRASSLFWGDEETDKTVRYFISNNGRQLLKRSPPKGKPGAYKRANGVTEHEYLKIMNETNWQWDERVCTKNKSVYQTTETSIQAGYLTTLCNDINDFDFNDLNYEWYINEARKLII